MLAIGCKPGYTSNGYLVSTSAPISGGKVSVQIDTPKFSLNGGDFTIAAWTRHQSGGDRHHFFSMGTTAQNFAQLWLGYSADNEFIFSFQGGTFCAPPPPRPALLRLRLRLHSACLVLLTMKTTL